jgi:hypothetical protein
LGQNPRKKLQKALKTKQIAIKRIKTKIKVHNNWRTYLIFRCFDVKINVWREKRERKRKKYSPAINRTSTIYMRHTIV